MKHLVNITIVCFLLFFTCYLYGQKYDNFWIFGYGSNNIDSSFGGSTLDFNSDPIDVSYIFTPMNMYQTNASICNSAGQLQLYTNGIYIANYMHEMIVGSDTLNPGYFNDDNYSYGYPVSQGAMIFPVETNEYVYNVLHMKIVLSSGNLGVHADGLYCTSVDMELNNGHGGVLEKRVPVLLDTLVYGNLTATKHADGVNWWIVLKEYNSRNFYKILFTPTGVGQIQKQTCGTNPWGTWRNASFSPDGTKYAEFAGGTSVSGKYAEIFDFDRCTGELSNPLLLHFFDDTNLYGLAFSPNSRFLYLSSGIYLYQYDMWADDIDASKDTIAIYDGSVSPFPTPFLTAQLAPDGKIYINSPNGNNVLHVIHEPNLKGDSCHVEQNGIHLPTYNFASMPNFPNYRLGAIPPITPSFSYSTAGDTAFFQNTSINGAHFEWDFGDGTTGTGSVATHVYAQPGSYPVTLTVSQDCLSEVAVDTVAVVFTGSGEMQRRAGFSLYPNPADDWLTVGYDFPESTGLALSIYNSNGMEVERQELTGSGGSQKVSIGHLSNGIYYCKILENGKTALVEKLVILR